MAQTIKEWQGGLTIKDAGLGSPKSFKVKQTSPGVMTIPIGKSKPSRPQNKERMTVGGSKATMRHKGRVDPKAANPKDPGPSPDTSKKGVQWPTNDKNAKKGYVTGKAWPDNKTYGVHEDAVAVTSPHE